MKTPTIDSLYEAICNVIAIPIVRYILIGDAEMERLQKECETIKSGLEEINYFHGADLIKANEMFNEEDAKRFTGCLAMTAEQYERFCQMDKPERFVMASIAMRYTTKKTEVADGAE